MTKSSGFSRRSFLSTTTGVAGAVALTSMMPRSLVAASGERRSHESFGLVDLADVKTMVLRGVDVARSAGAEYADVRMTHTFHWQVSTETDIPTDDDNLQHVSVRAFVNGYWGFASSPLWEISDIDHLARRAVAQAKDNARGPSRPVDLGTLPVVRDGRWVMPTVIDPLSINAAEVADYIGGLCTRIVHNAPLEPGVAVTVTANADFVVQERAFGATNGSYTSQRIYRTSGALGVGLQRGGQRRRQIGRNVDLLTPAGVGWELFRAQPLYETAIDLIRELQVDWNLPLKAIEVGRYDTLLNALSVAAIVSPTIGAATELDRSLGFEANASGTSYLNDPLQMRGTYVLGTPQLTVSADRSTPGAVATVQWDDEGVAPRSTDLVSKGIIQNFQTTREGAGWFKLNSRSDTASSSAGNTLSTTSSCGYAYAPTAAEAPLPHTANLVMTPGASSLQWDDMIAGMKKGIVLCDLTGDMDFQQSTGYAIGRTYEVQNGKRVAEYMDAGVLFRTADFWKSLVGLGGSQTTRRYGLSASKGEPAQRSFHSVTAVPGIFKDLTFIDVKRKA